MLHHQTQDCQVRKHSRFALDDKRRRSRMTKLSRQNVKIALAFVFGVWVRNKPVQGAALFLCLPSRGELWLAATRIFIGREGEGILPIVDLISAPRCLPRAARVRGLSPLGSSGIRVALPLRLLFVLT